jgi:hypothetical protein
MRPEQVSRITPKNGQRDKIYALLEVREPVQGLQRPDILSATFVLKQYVEGTTDTAEDSRNGSQRPQSSHLTQADVFKG